MCWYYWCCCFFTLNADIGFAVKGTSKHKLPVSVYLDPCPHSVSAEHPKVYSLGPLEPDRDLDNPRMGPNPATARNLAPQGAWSPHSFSQASCRTPGYFGKTRSSPNSPPLKVHGPQEKTSKAELEKTFWKRRSDAFLPFGSEGKRT